MNQPTDEQQNELLAKALDGRLAPEQQAEFERQLIDDATLRQAYLDLVVLDSYLELEHRSHLDLGEFPNGETPTPVVRKRPVARLTHNTLAFFSRPTPVSLTVAALVMLMGITGMAFMAAPIYREITREDVAPPLVGESQVVARVSGSHDVVWKFGATQWQVGARLHSGRRLSLKSGLVALEFDNGATTILEGPCEFIVDTAGAGTLSAGQLTARVRPAAVGFTIQTPSAQIVDLGTHFGVVVTDEGTDIAVFEGKVKARGINANEADVVSIGKDQAFRVNATSARPHPIMLTQSAFTTALPQVKQPSDPYLAAVLADRPIGYWPLNDLGTKSAGNIVGRRHGVYHGDIRPADEARPGVDPGARRTHAARFDGAGDYVEIAYYEKYNQGEITLEAWVKLHEPPRRHGTILACRTDHPALAGYILYIMPAGNWSFSTGAGSDWHSLPGPQADVGRWVHLAATFQSTATTEEGGFQGIKRMYVNGKLVASEADAPYLPQMVSAHPLRIGGGANPGGAPDYFLNGDIAEVAIYGQALSPAEVQQHFQAATAASENNPSPDSQGNSETAITP